MSNVADRELCEELYRVSGWMVDQSPPGSNTASYINDVAQPYDLGYLLRKLPFGRISLDTVGKQWRSWYEDSDEPHATFADTPESSMCKLALELFKAGILPQPEPEQQ